jgi:ketosteroid isomerase-like protein
MSEDEVLVLTANDSFYQAFAGRDFARMDELWASARPVTCIHPGWSVLTGRGKVMASWRAILESDDLQIEPSAAQAYVAGDVAYVVCYEGARGAPPTLAATNVFVREDGSWKLVHHHAGQMAQAPEPRTSGPAN